MRRWKWEVAAALGWSLAGFAMLAGAARRDEVRTSRLVVEDGRGRDRVVVTVRNGQPDVALNDADGRTRVWLAVIGDPGVPSVILMDRDGRNRVRIATGLDGAPLIHLSDPTGDRRTTLTAPP